MGSSKKNRKNRKNKKAQHYQSKSTKIPAYGNDNNTQTFIKNDPQKTLTEIKNKKYGVVFYDDFNQALSDKGLLISKQKKFDQLNIVIKAEGKNDKLNKYGKIYAGEAWYNIHLRRKKEGWYNNLNE